jgi:hypothetical protein
LPRRNEVTTSATETISMIVEIALISGVIPARMAEKI